MANFNFRDYMNIGAMSAMGYALGWFPSTIFFLDLLLKTNLSVVCFYIRLLFFTYIYLRTCIHTYIHTYIHVHACMHTYIITYIHIHYFSNIIPPYYYPQYIGQQEVTMLNFVLSWASWVGQLMRY